jgi:hypothetical protein
MDPLQMGCDNRILVAAQKIWHIRMGQSVVLENAQIMSQVHVAR